MATTRGRQVVVPLTNKSGGSVAAGDVVIVDTSNDAAFTTTTTARAEVSIGVAQETIASNAIGRVLTHGYAALVNVPASVTRGHYIETHTVAKQATGSGTRRSGSLGQFLTGGTTPTAIVWGQTDQTTSATPTFVGARVTNSANVSLPNNTWTLATFDTEAYDSDAFHSTVTNTGRMTIPSGKGGKYAIKACILITATGGTARAARIRLNNATTILAQFVPPVGSGGATVMNLAVDYALADGDYVTVEAYQDSGGSTNIEASSPYAPALSLALLGT